MPLPSRFQPSDTLVDFFLDLEVDRAFNIGELDAALFSAMKLLPDILVVLLRISLGRVNPLLGSECSSRIR